LADLTTQVTSAASTAESGFPGEQENWKIGKGFSNTSLIRVTSSAKVAVLAYAGTSTAGQWFIPSMNELLELCKFARGQTTGDLTVACVTGSGTFKSTTNVGTDLGGFVASYYWSSTQDNQGNAWDQRFDVGTQGGSSNLDLNYVRPVRAF
jgi:hypothetical protein